MVSASSWMFWGIVAEKNSDCRRAWQQLDHLADVVYEAHVEHGVRLVEHEILQLAEVDKALVDQVEQSSWSGHHDVHTTFERGHLFALLHTTKNHRMGDGEVGRIVPNALADLGRQLAGGAR